jgi:hypothetical protein
LHCPPRPICSESCRDDISLTRSFWLIRHADDARVPRLTRFAEDLVRLCRAEMARLEAV